MELSAAAHLVAMQSGYERQQRINAGCLNAQCVVDSWRNKPVNNIQWQ